MGRLVAVSEVQQRGTPENTFCSTLAKEGFERIGCRIFGRFRDQKAFVARCVAKKCVRWGYIVTTLAPINVASFLREVLKQGYFAHEKVLFFWEQHTTL